MTPREESAKWATAEIEKAFEFFTWLERLQNVKGEPALSQKQIQKICDDIGAGVGCGTWECWMASLRSCI